jgi:hypothetical protein
MVVRSRGWTTALGAWAAALAAASLVAQSPPVPPVDRGRLAAHLGIEYETRPTSDRVSRLNGALARGEAVLAADASTGYLRSLLDVLGISPESQLLVFSKTGIQRDRTGPRTPRALYFDESVVVGYIPGAPELEVAAHDPQQGVVFYTLPQPLDRTPRAAPAFERRTTCLSCHVADDTLHVPGMIVRSHLVGENGNVLPGLGSDAVDHSTRLLDRWGGWYVTGDYRTAPYHSDPHRGNVTVSSYTPDQPVISSNRAFVAWMDSDPVSRGYLSAESDIATLMVFDHQMRAINLLTRLNWEARASGPGASFSGGVLGDRVNELVDYFLFVGDQPAPTELTPRPGFARRLAQAAPKDRTGRSLAELDAYWRLLRYPCSYMIYAPAFDGLPPAARTAVYGRLAEILGGRDPSAKYQHLSPADRRAILEILRDTKRDLPAAFARGGF